MGITRKRLDEGLFELGQADLEIQDLEGHMLAELDQVRKEYTDKLRPLKAKRDRLAERLEARARDSRDQLFEDGGKTLKLGFGELSVREKPARIEVTEGTEERDVVIDLEMAGRELATCVRVKKSLDRNAIKRLIDKGKLDADGLARVGLEVVAGEEAWALKPNHEAIRAVVAKS